MMLRRMANQKATGGVNVPTELLKDARELGTRLLCRLFDHVWRHPLVLAPGSSNLLT